MNALIRIFWTLVALALYMQTNTAHADLKRELVRPGNSPMTAHAAAGKSMEGHRWRPV
jgi:hypothetical protein